jgi:hypothetical protein
MAQDRVSDPSELGRLYTTWFYEGQFDELWPRFSSEFAAQLGGEQGLRAFRDQVRSNLGDEARLVSERVESRGNASFYTRIVEFEKAGGTFSVDWFIDADSVVLGFRIVPEEPERYSAGASPRSQSP